MTDISSDVILPPMESIDEIGSLRRLLQAAIEHCHEHRETIRICQLRRAADTIRRLQNLAPLLYEGYQHTEEREIAPPLVKECKKRSEVIAPMLPDAITRQWNLSLSHKCLPNGMTLAEMKRLLERDPLRGYALILRTAFFCC